MTAVPPPTDPAAWLTELETARDAGTPGPWYAWDRGVGWHIVTEDPATVGRGSVPVTLPEGLRTDLARAADAALIVAAVNALPRLVAAVRAVEALADELELRAEATRLPPADYDRGYAAGLRDGENYAAGRLRAALGTGDREGGR